MRRIFPKVMWLVAGAIFSIVLIEAVLRQLPVTMGLYRTTQFARWPLQSSEPALPYANSHGWTMFNSHRGVTNNYGHIASFDYKKNSQPVLVIGDSFIESLMNDYADTLQAQLGRMLDEPESVYGLGVSGLSASDYVALSHLARDEFSPKAAIFLITDGDFSESLRKRIGNYYLVPNGASFKLEYAPLKDESFMRKVRSAVGDISIYRYFQVNLQFSTAKLLDGFRNKPEPQAQSITPVENSNEQKKIAEWFLTELPSALGLSPECIVFLMDSDRYAIYKAQLASPRKDNPEVRKHFIEQAHRLGFMVSDLDPVFRTLYATNHIKFDYWPQDRHWNRVGHGVGAKEAYRLLLTNRQPQRKNCLPGKT